MILGRNGRRWFSLLALIAIGALPVAFPPAAHAQTPAEFIVTSTLDKVDVDLVDDICDAEPGLAVECTLRAAVMQANVTPGEHVIRLQPVLYRLTIPGANENQSLSGDLDLRGRITIIGVSGGGRTRSIVDATGLNDRIFDGISPAATLQGLTISGVTVIVLQVTRQAPAALVGACSTDGARGDQRPDDVVHAGWPGQTRAVTVLLA